MCLFLRVYNKDSATDEPVYLRFRSAILFSRLIRVNRFITVITQQSTRAWADSI
jgi:hypothetical protein